MQFYIVTGGYRQHGLPEVASTEILKKDGGTSWQTVASLPSGRTGIRGVSLPNGHFMVSGEDSSISSMFYGTLLSIIIGGFSDSEHKSFADVLDYDPDADKWTKVGEMAKARHYHGMSLVPKETADYCV